MRKTLEERFWEKVDKSPHPKGCWVWTACTTRGYGTFRGSGKRMGGTRRMYISHRFSWGINGGPIPDGLCVCHKCDNKLCVRPDHLFLGTRTDNANDRDMKGRTARGEKQGLSKLTEHQVREIKYSKLRCIDLAKIYGVGHPNISDIRLNKKWKHITPFPQSSALPSSPLA